MPVLTGLSAFPITPADPAGRVDVGAVRVLAGRLCAAGVGSIGLLGSTGTYAYLSRAERRRALDSALEEVAGRAPVLVGIGALRTDEAIALAQDAKAAGASAGLLAAMSYTPLTEDEVFAHFAAVARDGGLPICIYDNPGTTHFKIGPDLLARLSRIDGVVAVKSPTPDGGRPDTPLEAHLAELRACVPADFSVGFSVDWNAAEAVLAGGDTWYSVVAGLFPVTTMALWRAAAAGDAAGVRALNARLAPLWNLFKAYSSLRVIYACAEHMGLSVHAPPRPILPLPDEARQLALRVAEELGLE
jgi:4-hydroxy-tetrahydrodipicolinate synthase